MPSPEEIQKKAAEVEAKPKSKIGTAKHFDQPGVRFSIPELRDLELKRKTEQGTSFRQHVEEGLLNLWMNPQTDWDKKNAPKKEQLAEWLKLVQSGKSSGGGAMAASKAREESLKKDVDSLKAEIAALKAAKAKA